MLSLIPLLAISGVIVYGIATLKMLTAVVEAPVGYEDEAGFHYGIETGGSERAE